jgi:hypothetical protein
MDGSPGSFLAKIDNDILAWDAVRDQKKMQPEKRVSK